VRVRIVTELDYLREGRRRDDAFDPGGRNEENRVILSAILRSATSIYSDFNPAIFHQKFIIRDRESLLTGSTNFTVTGTSQNFNHLVIVHDKDVAKEYSDEFKEIREGSFGRFDRHKTTPRDLKVGSMPVRVLFAPDHNPEMEFMKQISKARRRIDFAIFTFSQSSGVDDALAQAKRAGIEIHGVMDAMQANQRWAAKLPLRDAGVRLHLVQRGQGVNKLHHKLMVIDDEVVIAGSFNYTGPANAVNDENIIIFGDTETQSQASRNVQGQLGAFARAEIDRIIDGFGRLVPLPS
jgi:phosphatidylserine/phosphatidylglycerophosphate/cardiolipin synthase-like enzyme